MLISELPSETLVALMDYLLMLIEDNKPSTAFSGIHIEEMKNRYNDYNVQIRFIYNFKRYRAHIESSYSGSGSIHVVDARIESTYGKSIDTETYDRLCGRLGVVCRKTGTMPDNFDAVLNGIIRADTITNILLDI